MLLDRRSNFSLSEVHCHEVSFLSNILFFTISFTYFNDLINFYRFSGCTCEWIFTTSWYGKTEGSILQSKKSFIEIIFLGITFSEDWLASDSICFSMLLLKRMERNTCERRILFEHFLAFSPTLRVVTSLLIYLQE